MGKVMTTEQLHRANKEIFDLAQSAHDHGAGCDSYVDLKKDGQFFLEMEDDDLERKFIIYTLNFVAEISCEIILSDTFQENGKWEKKYNIENITQKYRPSKVVQSKLLNSLKCYQNDGIGG